MEKTVEEKNSAEEIVEIEGHQVRLARPIDPPPCHFIGRRTELAYCETAWDIDVQRYRLRENNSSPLHFRLHGPPGVGKNEIVYEIARRLKSAIYTFQGHEEVTPEDLAIHLIPDSRASRGNSASLVLRASSLATAIYKGGLFFFDEINRVPERALSPLASVLDGRQYIESAMTGLRIRPKDDVARKNFRFACALNPGLGELRSSLPEYIEQRTLPVIEVGYCHLEELSEILEKNLACSQEFLEAFKEWYNPKSGREISARQAISLMIFAMRYKAEWSKDRWSNGKISELTCIKTAASLIFGHETPNYRKGKV